MDVGRDTVIDHSGHFDSANLFTGLFVDKEQGGRFIGELTCIDERRLGHQHLCVPARPGLADVDAFERCILADAIRRLTDRQLPQVIAGVHINGRDVAVRRLEHWNSRGMTNRVGTK